MTSHYAHFIVTEETLRTARCSDAVYGTSSRRINEVTLHRARLVLRWVTVSFRRYNVSVCNQPPRPTQPPALSGMVNEYRPR